MPFDEALADRVRDVLVPRAELSEPHTRPMDFTGRPMKGMIFVEPPGTEADEDLAGWVEAGADFAASLPPK